MDNTASLISDSHGQLLEDMVGDQRIQQEANSDVDDRDKLIRPDMLEQIEELRGEMKASPKGAFFSTEKVIILPGYIASSLSYPNGDVLWISPKLYDTTQFSQLQILPDRDNGLQATGPIPFVYDLVRFALEVRRYSVSFFPFDWRKDMELAAQALAGKLYQQGEYVSILAHSQGSLVALKAIQKLGTSANYLVKKLILISPTTRGSYSAPLAIAGFHSSLPLFRKFISEPPQSFPLIFGSMPGTYQLFPWANPIDFWPSYANMNITLLQKFYGWAGQIDVNFFRDKISIILGDNYGIPTTAGVAFTPAGQLVTIRTEQGDGTVPDTLATIKGVISYRAVGTEHSAMCTYRNVIGAIVDILAGRTPNLEEVS